MIKLADALVGVRRIGFDTPPLIHFVERVPVYVDLVRDVMQRIDTGVLTGYAGMVCVSEVLFKSRQLGNAALESAYRNVLFGSRNFFMVPIDAAVAARAADLRVRYRIKLPDALQVAAALESGCEALLTNDGKDLRPITELRVLILDDLEL